MVRSPNSQEVTNQRSIKPNEDEIHKQNPIWDSKKKRPSNLTFFLLIALTIIFLISGVLSVFASYHEIKVVIDCDREYWGNIDFRDNYNSIESGLGLREFSYSVREGLTVSVFIFRSSNDIYQSTLTIEIYDNGDLVTERTYINTQHSVHVEYTVGDF